MKSQANKDLFILGTAMGVAGILSFVVGWQVVTGVGLLMMVAAVVLEVDQWSIK